MKNFSNEYLSSVVGKKVLTLAECMKITLKSGEVFAFTNHTRSITFIDEPNLKYIANGIVPSAFSSASSFAISNLNIELLIDDVNIKRSDLEKNKFVDAEVEFFEVNWMLRPYSYAHRDRVLQGTLGEISRTESKFQAEFVSKTAKLQQVYTRKLKATCDNEFGVGKCKLDVVALGYTQTTTVSERLSASELKLNSVDKVNDYFTSGTIEILSGAAKGERLSIKTWDNTTKKLKTQLSFVELIQVGDSVIVTRGCNKLFKTCVESYNNAKHFNGFPKVPGQDYMATGKGTGKS